MLMFEGAEGTLVCQAQSETSLPQFSTHTCRTWGSGDTPLPSEGRRTGRTPDSTLR